jgi:DNA-binding IclR family transcriptional regulator
MSSIRRSVQVMELLARKGAIGVRPIAQQLALPLGSVHRLLLDLEAEGVAERTPDGEWALSFRLLEITGIQLERIELPHLARPFADRIAEKTGETVNVYAFNGMASVCVDKVRGNEGMQLDMRLGSRGSINAGGAGKAVLAFMIEEDREKVLAEPLPALTPSTITDPAALRAELVRVRARGYSIDDQEVVIGIYCVSVPILDRRGGPAGAISITGPSIKCAGAAVAPLVDMLNEACGYISRRLGYAGRWPLAEAPAAILEQPA